MSYFFFQVFTENLNLKFCCSLWRCKAQIKKEKILAFINEYLKCSCKYYIFSKIIKRWKQLLFYVKEISLGSPSSFKKRLLLEHKMERVF